MRLLFSLLLLVGLSFSSQAQAHKYNEVDPLIKTLYGVISGPAGERDWDTFRDLYYEGAMMGSTMTTKEGEKTIRMFTPEDYIKMNGPFFMKNSFEEKELKRVVNRFGSLAQVYTSYAFSLDGWKTVAKQGINCIQLVYVNNRWYITQIIWQAEEGDLVLPADMK